MALHESSVNYRNLIRDLAEMYPFDISEVVIIELVANSLDAKSTQIKIDYFPDKKVLVIEDNGHGMSSVQFDEYHDFAAGLKTRGTGIGFAGLGAKVSFNIADRVITETRSKSFFSSSNWYFQSKRKLLWEDMKPIHLRNSGTRVEVHFRLDTTPSFKSMDDIVSLLHRHYLPLFDSNFLDLYEHLGLYSKNLRFVVNGHIEKPGFVDKEYSLDKIREFFPMRRRKKYGYGVFGVSESEYPIAQDVCGVLLCTYGKVIKPDLFNQFPGSLGSRLFGLVEIPELVKFLTTSKTDFMKKGRHKEMEKLYGPIRQEFKDWLGGLGIESSEISGTDEAKELERELRRISEDIPELGDFFGFWTRKNILRKDEKGEISALTKEGIEVTFPLGQGMRGEGLGPVNEGDEPGEATVENEAGKERARPISRKARRGPKIAFIESPERVDLAWVEGSNVVINSGHPSYIKSRSSVKTRRLHSLFAVASAIQRFIGKESDFPDFTFVDRMMSSWGQK